MVKVVIVDNEHNAVIILQNYLERYIQDIQVVGIANSKQEAITLLENTLFDLVLLDINLGDGSGFDVLDSISKTDFKLIFITAYDEHAIKAFKYAAIDYLLKPINPEEFIVAIDRAKNAQNSINPKQIESAVQLIENKTQEKIVINSSHEIHFLEISKIVRLESYKNYTDIYMHDGTKITSSKTLKFYDNLLPETSFVRIHQKHLVNTAYVTKFLKEDGGYLVLDTKEKLEVSRRKKEGLLKLLFNQ